MQQTSNPYAAMLTPEDRRDMRTMMLLQTGLGLLSNNRTHINNRMNPANIIGSGFQGYQQGLSALEQSRMRQEQFQMQKSQFEAEQKARQQEISDKAYQRQLLRDANQTNWHPLGDAIAGGAPPLAPEAAEGLLPTRSGLSRERAQLVDALAVSDPQAAIKAALEPGATPEWKEVYNPGTGLMEWIPETGLQPGMPSAAPKTEKPSKPFPALDANGQPTFVTPEQFANAPPGTYRPMPEAAPADGDVFAGTGMTQQAMNVLLSGDPASPQYAAAYNYMAEPKMSYDPATGQLTTIRPNMSAFRQPTSGASTAVDDFGGVTGAPAPTAGGFSQQGVGTTRMTEGQSTTAVYADRMAESNQILNSLEQEGTGFWNNFIKRNAPDAVENYMLSSEFQQFDQARRNFVNAVLRKESGAVISDEEFANAERQYFPVPGDSDEVIAQKRRNRQTAIDGIRRAAGPGYKPSAPAEITRADLTTTMNEESMTETEVIDALADKYGVSSDEIRRRIR